MPRGVTQDSALLPGRLTTDGEKLTAKEVHCRWLSGSCHPQAGPEPDPRSHEGYHWLYVLNGRLRVVLGDQDLVLAPGEVAEFDTHLPHWFGNADEQPVEFLSILGPQGERFHIRVRYRRD
jgi:mannose-6-phosphate isomerase-like protein (cupin superfamily)